MRKLLFTAVLLLLLMALPVCAHAWEWDLDSAGTLKITGSGAVENFESASATPWSGKVIKNVVVSEGITSLGNYAFRNYTKLTSVTLPDSLVTLGVSAFEGCSALKTVTFGTGLRTVKEYAFQDCTALTGVYIRDLSAWCAISYADYSSSPMYHAKALYVDGQLLSGTLELSSGVTKIPKYAFYGCTGITSIQLPGSVKTIESDAFAYCSGLTAVDLGKGVTTVGSAAFSYCNSLATVTMGNQVTSLADYAFYNCAALETVSLSGGLQQLGQRAFFGCTKLCSIQLPEGLKSMGSYAFYGCTALKAVSIPSSLTTISDYAFRGCTGLTELTLADTVTSIGRNAFYGCTGITMLTIPRDLTTLGNYAFHNCSGLTQIRYNAVALSDLSAGNYVFYKAGKTGLTVTVAAQVTKIPAYLFYPYSSYCPNVENIIFEPGSNCTQIGKYAFANCKNLKKVVFTGATPSIGEKAFSKVSAQCYYPASWDRAVLQQYDGTITWIACDEVEKIDIDVARMILGNALEFQFGVAQTKIPDKTGFYAVIEKEWADGTTTQKTIPATEWGTAGQYWAIVYDGLAAKEMGDIFYVTIYNAKGVAVSNAKEDSVRAYVERAYASQKATGKTMMVDMLNYGAAAQVHFSYGTDDLANSKLTDAQKATGTATAPEMSNDQVKGANYNGTRFILESRIQVQLAFKNMTSDMYAVYTYTNAAGKEQTVRVEGTDFVIIGGKPAGVELSALVYADARALVNVTLYKADGTVYGTATDSIESCSLRSGGDVFVALMKFADSAKASLYG